MTAHELVVILTQLPFVIIAGVTIAHAIRKPRRSTIDIALLFAIFAVIVLISWITSELNYDDLAVVSITQVTLVTLLPYLLLRVVHGFLEVPANVHRLAAAVVAFLTGANIATGAETPVWLLIGIALYFAVLSTYIARAFWHGARSARGVTSRRLHAAAAGSILIGLVIVVAVAAGIASIRESNLVEALIRILTAAGGISYFVAFSPPRLLRHAWQEPELREMLSRVAVLPRLPQTDMIVRELEDGAAAATGARGAWIGLWDAERSTLRYLRGDRVRHISAEAGIPGRSFTSQQAIFSENAPRDDPEYADAYRRLGASAILAAPITAGDVRLGVLAVFAARPPIFADEDLQLVQLLADQAAVILESRALIDATTRVQAREEATRLRDEFLVAAAHDLRTPLTAVITRTQFIRRRALRNPETPIDVRDIERIDADLHRLNGLINELLDSARMEHGQLLSEREPVDLAELIHDATTRHEWNQHRLRIDAPEPVCGAFDRTRIAQVVDNLLENAIRYTPPGGEVRVSASSVDGEARLMVSDDGVGIPTDDLPHVFERFYRAENAEGAHSGGMGLGLYICRGIVEAHGGRIAVESTVGAGTTFTVHLPIVDPPGADDSSAERASTGSGTPAQVQLEATSDVMPE